MKKIPDLTVILSELDTLIRPDEERLVLHFARQAEDAGYYGVNIIDHIVMGKGAARFGLPANPRAFRWVGNQRPNQHMPSQIVMMSAIAAVTSRIRLMATATLTPLRHPLLNAKQWATLDLLSGGRLTITPIGGWQDEEYDAMGIPFAERGSRLDEQLEIMCLAWSKTPISYSGQHYRFENVYVMPKPAQPGGPEMIIGGDSLSQKVVDRIVRYGAGYTLAGTPDREGLERLRRCMVAAGRKPEELKTSGLIFPCFPSVNEPADIPRSLAQSMPSLLEAGVDVITIKPSQYIDDPGQMPSLLKEFQQRIASYY
ncbi:TIGR03619 family F420-dependent LLM class oxidoreductase [Denitratisoma sp. DHT3]|uniref:TIGR03619 family F420-dependent LLM class oxidoreductase n=1 Tax=Denitratisoma sp. DHT3 TaxID=1981880 RepID=UPI0016466951|nr:TIGR03619 family F420-dependent LLM class oxidoreductase [Denitratisoma sp. DHT3]